MKSRASEKSANDRVAAIAIMYDEVVKFVGLEVDVESGREVEISL